MAEHDTRPVFISINPSKFRFPLAALASITHRISGVVLFVGIGFALYGLHLSLASQDDFDQLQRLLTSPLAKFISWGLLSALIYHLVAGIKHLLLDMDIGDTIRGGKIAAQITVAVSAILIVLAGVWIW